MPKALKKRKPKPEEGPGHELAEKQDGASLEDIAGFLARKLEFHFTHDKDADRTVDQSECKDLLQALGELREKVRGVHSGAFMMLVQKFEKGLDATKNTKSREGGSSSRGPAAYLEMKVQLLLSYLIALTYYLLLKVKGVPVENHAVVPRLLWIRSLLEKLKPVDQRLQYQMNKLLQWTDAKRAEQLAGTSDAHALRPGALATTVADEEEEAGEAEEEENKEDGVYRPPKIAQVEYTGDHISMQEKAEKELERKKARLERSEFMRSLREEFTDAPREILGEEKSARAAKAERLLQEQQEYEEDTMTRIKVKKADLRKQRQALREGRQTSGGAVSLYDAAADFNDIIRGSDRGRGRGRGLRRGRGGGGGVLKEYEDAKRRVQGVRSNVAMALDSAPGKRKRGGGSMKGKARRR